jgi:hypothetical protein
VKGAGGRVMQPQGDLTDPPLGPSEATQAPAIQPLSLLGASLTLGIYLRTLTMVAPFSRKEIGK